MGMGKRAVDKAYEVLQQIKDTVLPELVIKRRPTDYDQLNFKQKAAANKNEVYGYGKLPHGGWESMLFMVENPPSAELLEKWEELKDEVGKSAYEQRCNRNEELWEFGWY